jgi:ferric-dicitrate binding protein FerR (iron transport regulator)
LNDATTTPHDPVWDLAWSWVIRQHDRASFDPAAQAELLHWLAADLAHRQAFDKAGRLWLAAGLLPPVHAIDLPGAAQDDCRRDS